jgi:hypothetical protein
MKATESLLGVAFGIIMAMFLAVLLLLSWMTLQFLWFEHRWALVAVVPLLVLAVVVLADRRKEGDLSVRRHHGQEVHRGISMHAIPVAGGMGLVFVVGYLWMFWFGVPGFRPIVVAAGVLGLVLGLLLILWRRWRA